MKNKHHKIGIIGLGYVGTACEIGFSSIPNVEIRVHDKYKDTESLETVVRNSDILFVCVPTPMLEDGGCDTSIVKEVAYGIDKYSDYESKTIVIKSTVPPGTTDALASDYSLHWFSFNPEFLTEKNFIDDFCNQKFIVIGKSPYPMDDVTKWNLVELYRDFRAHKKSETRIVLAENKVAEMFKYTVNSYLASKVSFLNEIYQICEASGIQYKDVHALFGLEPRLGPSHLAVPGPDGKFGFGGACFPKDVNALLTHAKELGLDPMVLETTWVKNLVVRDEQEWEALPQVNGNYG